MTRDVKRVRVDEAARPDSHATMDANERQPGQAPAQINFPPGLAPPGAFLGDTFSAGTIQQSQPLRQGCVFVEKPTRFRAKVVGRTRWKEMACCTGSCWCPYRWWCSITFEPIE